MINQGDIYWVDVPAPAGAGPGYRRPYVVVQNNVFNRSSLSTIVVCTITSNLRLKDAPGNIVLDQDETGLPKASVVNVTQLLTIDKEQLLEYVGTLPGSRLFDILDGIQLVLQPREKVLP